MSRCSYSIGTSDTHIYKIIRVISIPAHESTIQATGVSQKDPLLLSKCISRYACENLSRRPSMSYPQMPGYVDRKVAIPTLNLLTL
ncbi:uncharacterized protein BJ212DRAFT_1419193 [Suillus subaureus]|uniref:Uncharacterized protein n=1 Tax=Suillus subaureus TaxID=48587 RepID=A0A9P7DG66_9AGAM|nr:uncharacterized protein BJ212DRAFT_1419193 [Suillus subaureus]KAG1791505.1 hypothetical protein BJ212DRAFT_1419193 [Suillus subaureus]